MLRVLPFLAFGLWLSPALAFEDSPTFQRLAPLRASETSALPYIAQNFWRIYGTSSRNLGGLQPIRPVFGLPSFAAPRSALEISYLAESRAFADPNAPDAQALVRQLQIALLPKSGTRKRQILLPKPSLLSCTKIAKDVYLVLLQVNLPNVLPPGLYDILHLRSLPVAHALHLGLFATSRPTSAPTSRPTSAPAFLPLSYRTIGALAIHETDPKVSRAFDFVHLTDLHIRDGAEDRIKRVIDHLNQLRPQPAFVALTGDIVEYGDQLHLWRKARSLLERLEIPLFVTIGNHDYYRVHAKQPSLRPGALREEEGLQAFASHFHPFLSFRFAFGGYEWLALDTGPSATSRTWFKMQWVTVEGFSAAQIRTIQAFLQTPSREGHVLLAHAGPRASLLHSSDGCEPNLQGVLLLRRKELEASLLASFQSRPRPILYFHGHQHWNDIFRRSDKRPTCGFLRWPVKETMMGERPCWRELPIPLSPLLVGTQSASKHQHLRSGGLHELGLQFGAGAGAAYGYRLLSVERDRWKSASFRFYHRTTFLARQYEDGYLHPRAFDTTGLLPCPR